MLPHLSLVVRTTRQRNSNPPALRPRQAVLLQQPRTRASQPLARRRIAAAVMGKSGNAQRRSPLLLLLPSWLPLLRLWKPHQLWNQKFQLGLRCRWKTCRRWNTRSCRRPAHAAAAAAAPMERHRHFPQRQRSQLRPSNRLPRDHHLPRLWRRARQPHPGAVWLYLPLRTRFSRALPSAR